MTTYGDLMFKVSTGPDAGTWADYTAPFTVERGAIVYAQIVDIDAKSPETKAVCDVEPKFVPPSSKCQMLIGVAPVKGSIASIVPSNWNVDIDSKEGEADKHSTGSSYVTSVTGAETTTYTLKAKED